MNKENEVVCSSLAKEEMNEENEVLSESSDNSTSTGIVSRDYSDSEESTDESSDVKAFKKAIHCNNKDGVEEYIKNGGNVVRVIFDEVCRRANSDIMRLYLQNISDLNEIYSTNEMTLFTIASCQGNFDAIKILSEMGADINKIGNKHSDYGPIHVACLRCCVDTLSLLLEKGADIHLQNGYGETALHYACKEGSIDTVKLLLAKGAVINAQRKDGRTPFFQACKSGHIALMRFLLKNGADYKIRDQHGRTPLHAVCSKGPYNDWQDYNIRHIGISFESNDEGFRHGSDDEGFRHGSDDEGFRHGSDDEGSDDEGFHSLYRFGSSYPKVIKRLNKIVQLLLEHGDDINAQDNDGRTALYIGCSDDNDETVDFMLKHGAKINITNKKGQNPLHVACDQLFMTRQPDGNISVLESLLGKAKPSEISKRNSSGKTPLYLAVENNKSDHVELLLKAGADANIRPKKCRKSPLLIACDKNYTKIAKMLLKHGAKCNIDGYDGWSPLHVACEKGLVELVRLMLEAGADINKQYFCRTPLHIACRTGSVDIAELLLAKGADTSLRSKSNNTAAMQCVKYEGRGSRKILPLIEKYDRWNRRKHLLMVLTENKYLVSSSANQSSSVVHAHQRYVEVLGDNFLVRQIVSYI